MSVVRRFLLAVPIWSLGLGHFSAQGQTLSVQIDIKPGDPETVLEAKRGGMLPVAVLSTPELDATQLDAGALRMGPTGKEAAVFRSSVEDADQDGDEDLLLLFRMLDLKIECTSDVTLILTGTMPDGRKVEGRESVRLQGCEQK